MMEQAITEYLINALWQVPLLAAGAWCLVRIAKPQPHVQYCLWLAVLSLAVLLPTHGMRRVNELTAQPAGILARNDLPSRDPLNEFASNDRARIKDHQPLLALALFSPTHTVRVGASWAQWLVRLYLGSVILALLRVAQAWRAAWLVATHARESFTHQTAVANFSRRFGIAPPQTRVSANIASPMIVGVTSPVLLLPEDFAEFTAEEIGAALCHELAHIKRQDYLVNLGCELAAVPLVWHPALHLIQQRIRMTREMACDALAAREMKSDITYAKCLLSLANSMLGVRGMATQDGTIGLFGGWFAKSTLEERIMQLTEKTTMGLQARVSRVAVGAAMMSASFVLAATVHLAPTMANTTGMIAQSANGPSIIAPAPAPAPPPIVGPEQSPTPSESKPAIPRHRGHREDRALSAKEEAQIRQQMEVARQQMAAAAAMFHREAFQNQMEDAQREALDAKTMMFDSEQFKQQIEDAQRQAAKARDLMNSPEFKKQMEDAKKQALQASAMFDTPEFKQQMEQAKRQALQAAERLNNPEFKRQMEELQRKMGEMMKDFHSEIVPATPHP